MNLSAGSSFARACLTALAFESTINQQSEVIRAIFMMRRGERSGHNLK